MNQYLQPLTVSGELGENLVDALPIVEMESGKGTVFMILWLNMVVMNVKEKMLMTSLAICWKRPVVKWLTRMPKLQIC